MGAQILESIARMIRPLLMCLRLSRGVCRHNLQPRRCTVECHSEPRRAVRGLVSQTFWGIIEFVPTMSKKAWSSADMMGDEVLKLCWDAMHCGGRRSLSLEVGNPGSFKSSCGGLEVQEPACQSQHLSHWTFSFHYNLPPWNYL